MLCPKCGTENGPTTRFCSKCGNSMRVATATSGIIATPSTTGTVVASVPPAEVSALKRSRGVVIAGALMLLFLFWSPLVSCQAGGAAESISGAQIVELSLHRSSPDVYQFRDVYQFQDQVNMSLLVVIAAVPLIAAAILFITGRAWLSNEPARDSLGLPIILLVVNGLVLLVFWVYILYTDIRLVQRIPLARAFDLLSVTRNYWLMWLTMIPIGVGYRMEIKLAHPWNSP